MLEGGGREWAANPMANEKLAEGIVAFHNDTEKLRQLLAKF